MTQAINAAAARSWLNGLPGGGLGDELAQRWQWLADVHMPVVTVFGAYDTGKSSLLRRLIVDSGDEVPEWLTISARHETFDVDQCRIGGCVVRDTPGFVVGGTDVRADHNTQLANDAIALTDIAIVTVTPQLATAEYDILRDIVSNYWLANTLWFVITRFDEAGRDPESDLEGYRALAESKVDELRSSLNLDTAVPVFVVCQDFAQLAGSERNPDPHLWDEFREWDGMASVLAALRKVGDADVEQMRNAAEQRFWRRSVKSALAELRAEAVEYGSHADFTDDGLKQRESWTAQLDALRRAADAELHATVSDAVDDTTDEETLKRFGQALSARIETWHSAQHRNIDKLLQGITATVAIERERPSWARLQLLADAIQIQASESIEDHAEPTVVPMVEEIATRLLGLLADLDAAGRQRRGRRASDSDAGASTLEQIVTVGTIVLPLVAELAGRAESHFRQQAAEAADRERVLGALRADVQLVGDRAIEAASEAYECMHAAAAAAIIDATAQQVDMYDGLRTLMKEIEAQTASGEVLLGGDA